MTIQDDFFRACQNNDLATVQNLLAVPGIDVNHTHENGLTALIASTSTSIVQACLVIPGILSFIPTRYLYPSKNPLFSKTNWTLTLLWTALIGYLLTQEEPDPRLVLVSLSYPIFYLLSSFYVDCCILHVKRFASK